MISDQVSGYTASPQDYAYPLVPPRISEDDFKRLSHFIESELGIRMPVTKRVMLESRLSRRLRQCGISNYSAYLDFVFSDRGAASELHHMIDAVTTNKTDFYREADHFVYLSENLLPRWGKRLGQRVNIWSAGCSTGEEPYTLAIVLEEYKAKHPGFEYMILATDISTKVLAIAQDAVYQADRVLPVPLELKKRYMLRSRDAGRDLVRMKPILRHKVAFRRQNLMDEDYGFRERFDIIFCRNVIIYFDRPTQEKLIGKFHKYLMDDGVLFLGHSETMAGMNQAFRSLAPTVYQKR